MIEVVVGGVKVDAFDSGELLDIQDVFTVHGSGLREDEQEQTQGGRQSNNECLNFQFLQNLVYVYHFLS